MDTQAGLRLSVCTCLDWMISWHVNPCGSFCAIYQRKEQMDKKLVDEMKRQIEEEEDSAETKTRNV